MEKLVYDDVGFLGVQRDKSELFQRHGSHVTNFSGSEYFQIGNNCFVADDERVGIRVGDWDGCSSVLELVLWCVNGEVSFLGNNRSGFGDPKKDFDFGSCHGWHHNLLERFYDNFLEGFQLKYSESNFLYVKLELH